MADAEKTYGETDPIFTGNVTGLVKENDLGTISYKRTNTDENAGTYNNVITAEYTSNPNYTVTVNNGKFIIKPATTLTVSGTNYSGVYDGETHGATATTNVTEGTTISYSTDEGNSWSTEYPTIKDAGNLTVKVKAENNNYKTAECEYTLTVTPKNAVITVKNSEKTYGESDPEFTGNVTGLVNDNDLGTISYKRTNAEQNNAGTYNGVITAEYSANSNYNVTVEKGNFEIKKADSLTVTGENYSAPYDGIVHGKNAVANVVNGTKITYSTNGGESWSETAPTIKDTGKLSVKVKAENSNYELAENSYTLEVTKRNATITVSNSEKVYGKADPAFTGEVTNLVNSDDLGTITYKRTNSEENVGTYENVLTAEYSANNNYNVTVVKGDFKITKSGALELTVTNYNEEYDGNTHGEKASVNIADGTKVEYSTDNGNSWNENEPTIKDVGTVNVKVRATNSNYQTVYGEYTLEVKPRNITITADSDTKEYNGEALTANGWKMTKGSAVEGEEIAVTVTGSQTDYGTSDNVVTAELLTGNKDNYNIVCENGKLEITKKPVTITANNSEKIYGETDPVFTGTVEGLINENDLGTVKFIREIKNENAGIYHNVITAEYSENNNYSVTLNKGDFVIKKSDSLIVSGTNYSGVYDGEIHGVNAVANVVNGTKIIYSTNGGESWSETAPAITNVGSINVKVKAENSNYKTAECEYTLTVMPKTAVITVDNSEKTYGKSDPEFTGNVTGLVKENDLGTITYKRTNSEENVGTYEKVLTAEYSVNSNYNVTVVNGNFEIKKAKGLKIQVDDYTAEYNGKSHSTTAKENITDGTVIEYSIDGGKTWFTKAPSIIKPGLIEVIVRATNPNYETTEKKYTLTITEKEPENSDNKPDKPDKSDDNSDNSENENHSRSDENNSSDFPETSDSKSDESSSETDNSNDDDSRSSANRDKSSTGKNGDSQSGITSDSEKTNKAENTENGNLPLTGIKDSSKGLFSLAAAALISIFGRRKRKEEKEDNK